MKKYVIISGFSLNDANRGTAALGYGAFSFLQEYHDLESKEILFINGSNSPFPKEKVENSDIQGKQYKFVTITVCRIFTALLTHFGILVPFTKLSKYWKQVAYVAAINGGDGFSDIYGSELFYYRLNDTKRAMKTGVQVIQLPQTIGPFNEGPDKQLAERILRYSNPVYVRDDKYTSELKKMGVDYCLRNDLSFYMKPEPFDIKIKNDAIGLNISGLTYSNKFGSLSGQFANYPYLCEKIVEYFQNIGKPIYLISHSYRYSKPDLNNDDIEASRDFYSKLKNKNGVFLLDMDLKSPQTKYLISRMSFFVGTRMHANFAAIFTNVPLFGLAYSFKFQGAFEQNGIFGQTAMINNISCEQADKIVKSIAKVYNNLTTKK